MVSWENIDAKKKFANWSSVQKEMVDYFPKFTKHRFTNPKQGKSDELIKLIQDGESGDRNFFANQLWKIVSKRLDKAVAFMDSQIGQYLHQCVLTNANKVIDNKQYLATDVNLFNYYLAMQPLSNLYSNFVFLGFRVE